MIEFTHNSHFEDYINTFGEDLKKDIEKFLSRQDIQEALDNNEIQYLYNEFHRNFPWTPKVLTIILLVSDIDILEHLTEVPRKAFHRTDVFKVEIPNNISIIGDQAFQGCEDLWTVKLPKSIKEIGGMAFEHCPDLYEIEYKGTMEDWNKIRKGEFWHSGRSLYIKCSDGEIKLEDNE